MLGFYGGSIDALRLQLIGLLSASRADGEIYSYNKYLSVAARVVRRSLKEEKRLQADKRGDMELRFAKWSVSDSPGTSGPPITGH
jgi:hypothetical protein